MSMNRWVYVLLALICTAAAGGEAVSEKLAAQTRFDIPAQPLGVSLKQLADQAGIQILFEEQVVRGVDAPALRAQSSALHALRILLSNTGLEYTARNETVAVRKKSLVSSISSFSTDVERVSPEATGEDRGVPLHLAQADEKSVSPSKEGETVERETDDSSEDEDSDKDVTAKQGIPEVLVKGSRSLNVDIGRSGDDVCRV